MVQTVKWSTEGEAGIRHSRQDDEHFLVVLSPVISEEGVTKLAGKGGGDKGLQDGTGNVYYAVCEFTMMQGFYRRRFRLGFDITKLSDLP